jgi:hypothetical protein
VDESSQREKRAVERAEWLAAQKAAEGDAWQLSDESARIVSALLSEAQGGFEPGRTVASPKTGGAR